MNGVPSEWLLAVLIVLAGVFSWGFVYFIRKNDRDHDRIFGTISRLERRVIHLMAHHKPDIEQFEEGHD